MSDEHEHLHELSERYDFGGDLSWASRVFYVFMRNAIRVLAAVWFRVRVEGAENIPASGPCILAPVHRSNLDTPIMAVVTARRMRYMGKDSLWKSRFGAWFLTSLGGFPVARGTADREALRACEAVLARGEALVMFPEGTRRSGPLVEDLFHGPAFVSSRSDAPIVPIGLGGSERVMPKGAKWVRPRKVVIVIGEPIHPPAHEGRVPRRAVMELTATLQDALQRVFDEAQIKAGA